MSAEEPRQNTMCPLSQEAEESLHTRLTVEERGRNGPETMSTFVTRSGHAAAKPSAQAEPPEKHAIPAASIPARRKLQ